MNYEFFQPFQTLFSLVPLTICYLLFQTPQGFSFHAQQPKARAIHCNRLQSKPPKKIKKLRQVTWWFPFPKYHPSSFSPFHTKLQQFPSPCSDPACLEVRVVSFLHLKTLPTNPSSQPSGKEIPMDLYNHGINHPLCGYLCSEPPDRKAQCSDAIKYVLVYTIR